LPKLLNYQQFLFSFHFLKRFFDFEMIVERLELQAPKFEHGINRTI